MQLLLLFCAKHHSATNNLRLSELTSFEMNEKCARKRINEPKTKVFIDFREFTPFMINIVSRSRFGLAFKGM
jgi:hypothetical protein